MRAIVLAGGGGTRLRPLTYTRPKALVPVLNRPLLEYLLLHLGRHGLTDITLATSRTNQAIESCFGDGAQIGVRLTYAYEDEPLGSGGAIREVARGITETFVAVNGDIVTDLDITALLQRHRQAGALVSIALTQVEDPSRYGVADVDREGRIHRFIEKPPPGEAPSRWINAGIWVFEPQALQRFPEGPEIILDRWVERVLFPGIINSGELLLGYCSDAYWIDVGTPETYMQVQRDLLSGAPPGTMPWESGHGRLVADDALVDPTATLQGKVIIGAGCRIGGYVRIIGPTVLGPGSVVRDHACIERSVLWEHVRIGSGARITESVLGAGVRVGDNAKLCEALLGDAAGVKRGYELPPGARLDPGVIVP